MKIRRQTTKKRPYPEKLRQIKKKTSRQPRKNWQFTVSLTDEEIKIIKMQTKFLKGHLGIKRSEILRKVLLNLTNKKFLDFYGFRINKKY